MATTSLVESCLRVIAVDPYSVLSKKSESAVGPGEEEATTRSKSPLLWASRKKTQSNTEDDVFFVECAPPVVRADDGDERRWKDVWWEVREASCRAARRGESRPQIASELATRGRLVDGSLPSDFWQDLRCDALSLASSRAGPATLADLARAQSQQARKLVALDLGGCLLVDDDGVRLVAEACGQTLERLGLRDCRKLTDAVFDLLGDGATLPRLRDVDVGGDVNVTADGVRLKFVLPRDVAKPKRQKAVKVALPKLAALGVSGIGVDADFLSAAARALGPDVARLGLGYAKASSAAFQASFPAWPNLTDLRIQWTATFDDAALEVLADKCPSLKALDVVGTNVSADCLRRLLRRRAAFSPPDDPEFPAFLFDFAEDEPKPLQWLSCRYTSGPKLALLKLAAAYADSPIHVLLK